MESFDTCLVWVTGNLLLKVKQDLAAVARPQWVAGGWLVPQPSSSARHTRREVAAVCPPTHRLSPALALAMLENSWRASGGRGPGGCG